MDSIALLSPAKINLCLSVINRRSDGYHDVQMLMQMVGLYDRVEVALCESGIHLSCNAAIPSDERNVAWKAAKLMLDNCEQQIGLTISIEKQIPIAAGLAGGSGNAAAVMLAANQLLQLHLSRERLEFLGARIGMDVPFFFSGPTALAEGRGEVLTPIAPPDRFWVLLVNPGFETSTAWAYQNVKLRLTKGGDCTKIARLSISKIADALHNDLERVTASAHPVVYEIKQALLERGASGACMSGSGPTVFGIFMKKEQCVAAAMDLRNSGWRLYPVEALAKSPFEHVMSESDIRS